MPAANVAEFTRRYLDTLKRLYPAGLPEPSLSLSAWLEVRDLNEKLLEDLDRLHPFGQGNSEPIFGIRGVVLEEAPQAFGQGNFRFRLPASAANHRGVSGIAWRMESVPEVGQRFDLSLRFAWNYWRNSRYPQVTLVDWKSSEPGANLYAAERATNASSFLDA